jgi:hypothetical protein
VDRAWHTVAIFISSVLKRVRVLARQARSRFASRVQAASQV